MRHREGGRQSKTKAKYQGKRENGKQRHPFPSKYRRFASS